jgi:hypothetical protein
MQSVESPQTFQKNISPPSSGSRALLSACFQADFLLDLFFDPEDGGDEFLRNIN